MKIRVELDPACAEPEVVVRAARMTEEVGALLAQLQGGEEAAIAGWQNGRAALLEPGSIARFYALGAKVFACTVRFRLYELEERLKNRGFARISNSEIVRLGAVKEFDLSLAGAIRVIFWDGSFSYVSRRYVGKIKRVLGI